MHNLPEDIMKLLRQGWWLFPVKGKIPTTPHGFKDATNDPVMLEALLKKYPGDGIAGATGSKSKKFVLDVDVKNGAGGDDTLRELEAKNGELPETVQSITASKGGHRIYNDVPGTTSNAGVVGKGLDIRSEGGYVVLPPSPGYSWEVSHNPDDIAYADAPQWLIEAANRKKQAPDLSHEDGKITRDRNETLTSIAGSLRRNGLEADAVYAAISQLNQRRCVPPLDEQEVRKIALSIARYEPKIPKGAYTDHWAAELFKAKYGENLHWCDALGGWQIWDGTRWQNDEVLKIERMAYDVIKHMHEQAASSGDTDLKKFAIGRERDAQFRTMISRLRALQGIPARSSEFDEDTHKINFTNTTHDLQDGKCYEHKRDDMITRRCEVSYNPDAKAPRWEQFLLEVFDGNQDLIDYVQRAVGYSISGDITEHCMFVLYGSGRNGKSTFIKHIARIIGDYSAAASAGLLVEKRDSALSNDVARLRGTRLVVVQESKRGQSFDESQVKALTGGDRISARFLHKEFFEFDPTFKIWFCTNHKPEVVGTDIGIWRRIKPIPFNRVFTEAEVDKNLDLKLMAEYEGILSWMVAGYHLWRKHGLGENKDVQAAISDYQEESDVMKMFIEERCELTGSVYVSDLREAYKTWSRATGTRILSRPEMNAYFEKKLGLKREKKSDAGAYDRPWIWMGISLNENWTKNEKSIGHNQSWTENPADARPF